jgi:hypothetical protein
MKYTLTLVEFLYLSFQYLFIFCGSAAQRGLWPPVALQPSVGYGLLWLCSPAWAMASCGSAAQRGLWPPRHTRFLDHTQRCATVGRSTLDEWSARRRDLYLRTHNRKSFIPPVGFQLLYDRNRRAAVDLRLRPRDHWDWLLSCAMTNKCTIISQIITLLHVSTLGLAVRIFPATTRMFTND